jgi:hypothetical protein
MLMHHPGLRVNATVPDDPEVMAIWAESGWVEGQHADTDPDDFAAAVPRVLPATPTTKKVKD